MGLVPFKDLENDYWKLQYFEPREFACKCCGRVMVTPEAQRSWEAIDMLRHRLCEPIRVHSATRCEKHNKAVGGALRSFHLRGMAYDISTKTFATDLQSVERATIELEILWLAGFLGFGGVGIYRTFIHLDTRQIDTVPKSWFDVT